MRKLGMLAVAIAICVMGSAQAGLVARYTFDDVDTTVTGDGLGGTNGSGTPAGDPNGTPFNGTMADSSGNGNTATNTSAQLSQRPVPETNHYGMAIRTGEPGKFGESHKFWRDPSDFNLESANTTWTIAPGVVPSGSNERTIAVWFNQEVDVSGSQDKLWGYGTNVGGQALDLSLEGGGLRIRHFGGNITYGSGFDFDGTDSGWHHAAVRVNAGATTFADVDVFLDGQLLAVSATGGGGTGVAINTVEGVAASGFPTYGFGIGTSSERQGGSSQNGLQGWLDEFRAYDMALTNAQIRGLVPEPSSAVLLVLCLTVTLTSRRKLG